MRSNEETYLENLPLGPGGHVADIENLASSRYVTGYLAQGTREITARRTVNLSFLRPVLHLEHHRELRLLPRLRKRS